MKPGKEGYLSELGANDRGNVVGFEEIPKLNSRLEMEGPEETRLFM